MTHPSTTDSDVVRRYYELVDAGDTAGLLELFTDDAVYLRPGYDPLVGHDALYHFYSADRVIKSGRHRVTTLVPAGSMVAVNGDFTGTLKDDSDVRLRFADFFTLSPTGRFSRRETFFFAPMV